MYYCVQVKSVAGIGMGKRVEQINQVLGRSSMRIVALTRMVEYYNSKSRKVVTEELVLLYNYAFLRVPQDWGITQIKWEIERTGASVDLLSSYYLKKEEHKWVDGKLKEVKKVFKLTQLGTDFKAGDLIRIVNGPFSGWVAAIKEVKNRSVYVLDVDGLQLFASKNSIRGLDYDATDNDISSLVGFIR